MSDDKWYLAEQKPPSLHMWIFTQMTLGAAYAALVCMAILFFVLFWRALSALLPEDPFALLETGSRLAQAIA
ncbi:MAG: RC-LH1 core complex protein PufX [Paracoccaceae bacterium]|nr:RC-LH1 core complex protein PufX [Paracoccaceae bacterium]